MSEEVNKIINEEFAEIEARAREEALAEIAAQQELEEEEEQKDSNYSSTDELDTMFTPPSPSTTSNNNPEEVVDDNNHSVVTDTQDNAQNQDQNQGQTRSQNNSESTVNNTPVTLTTEQLLALVNRDPYRKSKTDKIQALYELSRVAIETFLYDYERKSKPADEILNFVGLEVDRWLRQQAAAENITLNNATVKAILRKYIATLDDTLQLGGVKEYTKQLLWPKTGSTIERITKFILNCTQIESRIQDISDPFVRKEFNKAICRIIPIKFGLTEDMLHHTRFNSLPKIAEFLKSRAWAVNDEDHNKSYKIQQVKQVEVDKIKEKELNETVLDQALAVIHEKSNLEINQLKQQVNALKSQLQNSTPGSNNNSQTDLAPLLMQMMQMNMQRGRQDYMNVPQFPSGPNNHSFNNNANRSSNFLNPNYPARKSRVVLALLQKYNLPNTARIYELNSTSQAIKCQMKVHDQGTRQNVTINGTLDSGAYTTAGSWKLHSKYCKAHKPVFGDIYLILPNGTLIKVNKAGIIDIDATNHQGRTECFRNVLIFLVEHDSWTELLIGRPTLKKHDLLPEQNFGNVIQRQVPELGSSFVPSQQ